MISSTFSSLQFGVTKFRNYRRNCISTIRINSLRKFGSFGFCAPPTGGVRARQFRRAHTALEVACIGDSGQGQSIWSGGVPRPPRVGAIRLPSGERWVGQDRWPPPAPRVALAWRVGPTYSAGVWPRPTRCLPLVPDRSARCRHAPTIVFANSSAPAGNAKCRKWPAPGAYTRSPLPSPPLPKKRLQPS